MAQISGIKDNMEVIGADGIHVGTVDKLEGDRIKLTKRDSGEGSHQGHHHYLSTGLVAAVEGERVRLSATAANAFMFQEEDDGSARYVTNAAVTGFRQSSEPGVGKTVGVDTISRNTGTPRPHVDWTTIGLGTAALGALAGAALLARRNTGEHHNLELRLQTDENMRLISSSKIEGTPVVGRDGEHLGKIVNFMVDKYTGRVAYAVMSFGGTLGFGESLFPLPWSYLTYDTDRDGYVLGVSKEQLSKAPRFQASDAPEFSKSYRQDLGRFYARPRV
jgi:hypothetical protein